MAVSKKVLRNLLGVRLAKLELLDSTGFVAKSIYSVGTPGDPVDIRFFPYLAEAEAYFFNQVRKVEARGVSPDGMPDLLDARVRTAHRI
jgi:hypothetical protein